MDMDYIKGKENKEADFLSRFNTETNEINMAETNTPNEEDSEEFSNLSMENNVDEESIETVHSQKEDLQNHIHILDTVVNRFNTQIILTNNKIKDFEIKHKNRKIYIDSNDLNNNLSDILCRYIKPGKTGIYTELNDTEYNKLQQKIIELFDSIHNVKFVGCSYHAKDMNNEEEAYRHTKKYHKYETGHTEINENYEGLKKLIYIPNLKT